MRASVCTSVCDLLLFFGQNLYFQEAREIVRDYLVSFQLCKNTFAKKLTMKGVTECIICVSGHDPLTFSFLSFNLFDWVEVLWPQLFKVLKIVCRSCGK